MSNLPTTFAEDEHDVRLDFAFTPTTRLAPRPDPEK